MTAVDSDSDLLRLKAEFLHTQSDLIHDITNKIHFAADALGYKAYEFENQSFCVRKAAWEMRSAEAKVMFQDQRKQDEMNVPAMIRMATEVVDAAEMVKIRLKDLIAAVSRASLIGIAEEVVPMDWTSAGEKVERSYEPPKKDAFTLISVMAEMPMESTDSFNHDYSRFRSVNPSVASSDKKLPITNTVLPMELDMDGSTLEDSPMSSTDDHGFEICSESTCQVPDQARSSMEATVSTLHCPKEELLSWIPPTVDIPWCPLQGPVDRSIQALMMGEGQRMQRERANH